MSTSIVIFGASGDLTRRKLIPALFNLHRKDRLPENFRIIGFAKTEWDEHRSRVTPPCSPAAIAPKFPGG